MRARQSSSSDGAQREAARLLGEFLRARRASLRVEDVGLTSGARRRVPGLRREEVAQLCGISATWYTWLEQGRSTGVSVVTLGAIARGLRLSRTERSYLFQLAARADPHPPRAGAFDAHKLAQLVQAVRTPTYVLDRQWDAVVWNKPAADLFEDWLGKRALTGHAPERNLLRYVFRDPRAAEFIIDWPQRARRLVAEYRADTATLRDDPLRRALVDELSAANATFATAWRSQQVFARDGGPRVFQHPRRGRCAYQQYVLRPAESGELKLTVLVAHGE